MRSFFLTLLKPWGPSSEMPSIRLPMRKDFTQHKSMRSGTRSRARIYHWQVYVPTHITSSTPSTYWDVSLEGRIYASYPCPFAKSEDTSKMRQSNNLETSTATITHNHAHFPNTIKALKEVSQIILALGAISVADDRKWCTLIADWKLTQSQYSYWIFVDDKSHL